MSLLVVSVTDDDITPQTQAGYFGFILRLPFGRDGLYLKPD